MRSHRSSRPRGVMLVEMLFAIFNVSVTILIAARLLQAIARVYRESPNAAATLQVQAQWLRLMRDDAWAAHVVDARPSRLTLTLGDGRDVAWHVEDSQLERTVGDVTQRWPDDQAIRWSAGHDAIVVAVGEAEVPLATPTAFAGRSR